VLQTVETAFLFHLFVSLIKAIVKNTKDECRGVGGVNGRWFGGVNGYISEQLRCYPLDFVPGVKKGCDTWY